MINTLLRTPATFQKYSSNPKRSAEECFICTAPALETYYLWKLVKNDFPYDAVARAHVMLVPKRHIATGEELFGAERLELDSIKRTLNSLGAYDAAIENFTIGRTFQPHYHLHLVKWKRQ